MQEVLREILRSQAHIAAGLFALWIVIGTLTGLAVGGVAALVLAKTGALHLGWKHAVWLRVLSCLWVIAAGAFFGGSIGGCEGTLRGTEKIVRESQFRTEGLRRAGEAVAGTLVWIDLAIENHLAKKDISLREEQVASVDAFLKGGREFDVRAFQGRLERAEGELVRKIVDSARTEVAAKMGLAPGGVPEALLGTTLGLLAEHGLRKSVRDQLEKHGLEGLFGGMDLAAKAKGDPATAALPELAEGIVDHGLIPLILGPARALTRGPQMTSLFLMLGAFLLPALGFAIGRKVEASWASAAEAAPGPEKGSVA